MHTPDTVPPSQTLAGLHAVVTGAASGIGKAVARQLMACGAIVHGLDRDGAALKLLEGETEPGRFVSHALDLADRAAVDAMLTEVLHRLDERCDILINNAGVSRLRSLTDTDDALLDWLFEVNFNAAFRVTRALLPALRASGRGSVVNIASELALVGQADYSAYCATKGAMLAWSRALALELAASGVRVNVVCPGPIDTQLLQEQFFTDGEPERARAAEIATVPLARLGKPHEVAATVAFLASDAAAFVTGAAWTVDGGKTAQ